MVYIIGRIILVVFRMHGTRKQAPRINTLMRDVSLTSMGIQIKSSYKIISRTNYLVGWQGILHTKGGRKARHFCTLCSFFGACRVLTDIVQTWTMYARITRWSWKQGSRKIFKDWADERPRRWWICMKCDSVQDLQMPPFTHLTPAYLQHHFNI